VTKLRQQLDAITQRSVQNEQHLKLALQTEKQAHDCDVDRLTADKVVIQFRIFKGWGRGHLTMPSSGVTRNFFLQILLFRQLEIVESRQKR